MWERTKVIAHVDNNEMPQESEAAVEQGDVVEFESPYGGGIEQSTVIALTDTEEAQLDDGRLMPLNELTVVA